MLRWIQDGCCTTIERSRCQQDMQMYKVLIDRSSQEDNTALLRSETFKITIAKLSCQIFFGGFIGA